MTRHVARPQPEQSIDIRGLPDLSVLSPPEQERFAKEIVEAAKGRDSARTPHDVIRTWELTAKVRAHPEFQRNLVQFRKALDAGTLYAGTSEAERRATGPNG